VFALDIAGGRITSVSVIFNPDKLTHLGPVADFESLLRDWKTGLRSPKTTTDAAASPPSPN
jgi:hypothetical protein